MTKQSEYLTKAIEAIAVEVDEGDETTKAIRGKPVKQTMEPIKLIKKVLRPTDKVNNTIFDKLSQEKALQQDGSFKYAMQTGTGKGGRIGLVYTIVSEISRAEEEAGDAIRKTRPLTEFDKLIHAIVGTLYYSGHEEMTVNQIYTFLNGNDIKASTFQLNKINDSLTKMSLTRVYIDNEKEIGVLEGYKPFRHDENLLSFRRDSFVGGDSRIILNTEPILFKFAIQRKQITAIPLEVLRPPLSKSEGNLAINDYLISRITAAKKGKISSKVLYRTLFDRCAITEKKQRRRAKETISTLLNHYVGSGFIKDYKLEKDGIFLFLD